MAAEGRETTACAGDEPLMEWLRNHHPEVWAAWRDRMRAAASGREATACGCPEEALIRSHVEGCPWFTAFVEAGREATPGDDCDEDCWGYTLEECGHGAVTPPARDTTRSMCQCDRCVFDDRV